MNKVLDTINSFPAPYSDLIVVIVLFIGFYLVGLIISKLSGKKVQEDTGITQEAEQPDAAQEVLTEDIPEVKEQEEQVIEEDSNIADEAPPPEHTGAELEREEFKPPQKEIPGQPELEEEVREAVQEPPQPQESSPEGLFSRLRQGLSKTHTGLFGKLDGILSRKEIDMELWDEFEESLISSDIGVSTTMNLREKIEETLSKNSLTDPHEIKSTLKSEMLTILKNAEGAVEEFKVKPAVMVVAGVNGVGKTTTIGKLAYKFVKNGKKVMIAAGDTFRAAAIEQLEVWSNRVGSDFIKGSPGADPSAVAFDALSASKARDIDILIIDTAGRLHTKTNLMDELKKIKRILGREMENSPHEVLMVLDATTGQNAIQQAKTFNEAIDITGIVLTKLDGTAKGGVIIAIANELNIPVKYIGIGESLEDLREFNAEEFVEALFISDDVPIH